MRRYNKLNYKILIFLVCFLFAGIQIFEKALFAFEKPLITKEADLKELKGNFNLILYGGRHSDDLETVAIFDIEGDNYFFEPFAPDFDYKIIKNVPSDLAIKNSEKFISFHYAFHKSILKRIIDNNGKTIGFELRPLYYPFVYGFADVMEVYYWLKENGRVKVVIKLIEPIERLKYPGGDSSGGDGGGN